ncbi:aspartate aminotransferase family protein [Agrobacterium rosae]|uniref:pyridoxal phosphate-dependent decarboxylase family protein n=1 Tax=Agrobacterium rosae TaxID=1972867 RepID=UPI0019D368D1|nr:aspartate aminotransferase family protein [Agrobacterium rosae]MBN7808666.1 aspartate aminotransferase family protein [Agrobacterium rosae]
MNVTVLQSKQVLAAGDELSASILGPSLTSQASYRKAMIEAVDLAVQNASRHRVHSGVDADDMRGFLSSLDVFPQQGTGLSAALEDIGVPAVRHALDVGNPATMAHLHCPVAVPALAAEVLISATNQSLDSWDQSPFATLLEERVLTWLTQFAGLPASASGSFTSGGSQSNMTALYLATERHGAAARSHGVIFTSEHSHFSIRKSASVLGFASDAVVTVPTDIEGRLSVSALKEAVDQAKEQGRVPFVVVATAGTTDLGAIDPLSEVADLAASYGLWLHVDAAYGGGLLFSRHRDRLDGIERADSVALDFHKMLFQPISCGALLLSDGAHFSPLSMKADYLNPEVSIFGDVPNFVESSVQTTRRSDALKFLMTLRAIGQDGLDALICRTLDNALAAAHSIRKRDYLRLAQQPTLSTVLFRYISPHGAARSDELTLAIRAQLFRDGTAALATTVLDGRVHFKLTLLNPNSTPDVIDRVLDAVGTMARELENDHVRL